MTAANPFAFTGAAFSAPSLINTAGNQTARNGSLQTHQQQQQPAQFNVNNNAAAAFSSAPTATLTNASALKMPSAGGEKKDERATLMEQKSKLTAKIEKDTQVLNSCVEKFTTWDNEYKCHPNKESYNEYVSQWNIYKSKLETAIKNSKNEIMMIEEKLKILAPVLPFQMTQKPPMFGASPTFTQSTGAASINMPNFAANASPGETKSPNSAPGIASTTTTNAVNQNLMQANMTNTQMLQLMMMNQMNRGVNASNAAATKTNTATAPQTMNWMMPNQQPQSQNTNAMAPTQNMANNKPITNPPPNQANMAIQNSFQHQQQQQAAGQQMPNMGGQMQQKPPQLQQQLHMQNFNQYQQPPPMQNQNNQQFMNQPLQNQNNQKFINQPPQHQNQLPQNPNNQQFMNQPPQIPNNPPFMNQPPQNQNNPPFMNQPPQNQNNPPFMNQPPQNQNNPPFMNQPPHNQNNPPFMNQPLQNQNNPPFMNQPPQQMNDNQFHGSPQGPNHQFDPQQPQNHFNGPQGNFGPPQGNFGNPMDNNMPPHGFMPPQNGFNSPPHGQFNGHPPHGQFNQPPNAYPPNNGFDGPLQMGGDKHHKNNNGGSNKKFGQNKVHKNSKICDKAPKSDKSNKSDVVSKKPDSNNPYDSYDPVMKPASAVNAPAYDSRMGQQSQNEPMFYPPEGHAMPNNGPMNPQPGFDPNYPHASFQSGDGYQQFDHPPHMYPQNDPYFDNSFNQPAPFDQGSPMTGPTNPIVDIKQVIRKPGRNKRADCTCILIRGLPGAGQLDLANKIKAIELKESKKENVKLISVYDFFEAFNDSPDMIFPEKHHKSSIELVKVFAKALRDKTHDFIIIAGIFDTQRKIHDIISKCMMVNAQCFIIEQPHHFADESKIPKELHLGKAEIDELASGFEMSPTNATLMDPTSILV